jgi:hypothetical protein
MIPKKKQWHILEKTQENFSLKINNFSKGQILMFGNKYEVLHLKYHSFAKTPNKFTGIVFRKNNYVTYLAALLFSSLLICK